MAKNRIILVVIVCFSMAGFAGQPRQRRGPGLFLEKGMTDAEKSKAFFEWFAKPFQQMDERDRERIRLMSREAWKRLLRISERQWKIIKPKDDKVVVLYKKKLLWSRGSLGTLRNVEPFHWKRPSRARGACWPWPATPARTPDELTESEKILEELIDVLEDENSKDEEIRQKRDTLQHFRENARRELPKAKQELAAVLTSPRQEAVFLIRGCID